MSARADTETEWTVWLRFCDFPFPFAVSVDAIYPLIHDLGNLEMFWICVVRESTHRRTGMHTGDKNEIKGREKKSIDRWPNSNATSDSQLLIRGGKNDSFPNQGICPRIFQGPFRIYVCGINGVNPTDSNLFPGVSGFFLGNAASFANLSRGMRRGIEHFDNVGIISFFICAFSSIQTAFSWLSLSFSPANTLTSTRNTSRSFLYLSLACCSFLVTLAVSSNVRLS